MTVASAIRRWALRHDGPVRKLGRLASGIFPGRFGRLPRPLAGEAQALGEVLRGTQWNMAYGKGLAHERLEADFAAYVGAPFAIAVNTGGMALQMSMRALGLAPGDEVLMQVDTCSAAALAVMNAACTPLFSDISRGSFMLPPDAVARLAGPNSKAVIATHMWGNAEDMTGLDQATKARGLGLIEDACLSLGARAGGRMAGTWGATGVFSFGCLKPIQAGEGGIIVTADEALARELRSLRHWGDRTIEYGVRDTTQLAWNGRMSEFVAAVAREQLKGYPAYLAGLRGRVADFARFLDGIPGLELVLGHAASLEDCAFSQVVLRLDCAKAGLTKDVLRQKLSAEGIHSWHANFEPITDLSLFRQDSWRKWILAGDVERAAGNYRQAFSVCRQVYESEGLGLSRMHFQSGWRLKQLQNAIALCMTRS